MLPQLPLGKTCYLPVCKLLEILTLQGKCETCQNGALPDDTGKICDENKGKIVKVWQSTPRWDKYGDHVR